MKKKIIIGSIIAVVLLTLVSFTSVVGKVSLNEELIEFDVEFCGLGKKHIVKLTQQEADEVELLFDEISISNEVNRIYIDGNENFTSENGVSNGSGTLADPFIITQHHINNYGNPGGKAGIRIYNTDAYFEISLCRIEYCGQGIEFKNVKNGIIKNCWTEENNWAGIYIDGACSNISSIHCYSRNNGRGIILEGNNCLLDNFTCEDNGIHSWPGETEYGMIISGVNNHLYNCFSIGHMDFDISFDVSTNSVMDSSYCDRILIENSNDIVITDNYINRIYPLSWSNGVTFERNNIMSKKFMFTWFCEDIKFKSNYWGRFRIFPKIIFGIPRIFFDNSPVSEPYDI